MEETIDAGVRHKLPPNAHAGECVILLLCVTNTAAVERLEFGPDGIAGGAHVGLLLADHYSINPDATRDFVARLKDAAGAPGWTRRCRVASTERRVVRW